MAKDKKEYPEQKNTGRYIYDKKLGKVVKISQEIPGLKKSGQESSCCPINPNNGRCNSCCEH